MEGYFDDCPFAVTAYSADQSEITEGMRLLIKDEKRLKRELGKWHLNGGAERFQRQAISDTYVAAIERVTKGLGQMSGGAE